MNCYRAIYCMIQLNRSAAELYTTTHIPLYTR